MRAASAFSALAGIGVPLVAANNTLDIDTTCKGYALSNVLDEGWRIVGDLDLIGDGCALCGPDVARLTLIAEYEQCQFVLAEHLQ